MHPILFELGSYSVRMFGIMAALGMLFGSSAVLSQAKREGVDEDVIRRTTFWAVIAVIVGGRALDVVVNWRYFSGHPGDIVQIWRGGLVFYGGAIAVLVVVALLARVEKLPILQLFDLYALGGMLGLAFGRVGCLMAGDDYGRPTSLPWGIRFTDPESQVPPYLRGVPLHPTQIYMMLNALLIFAVLSWMARRKKFHGQLAGTCFVLYAINRSIIELFRGDEDRGFLFGKVLSTSQFISIFVGAIGVAILVRGFARSAASIPKQQATS